MLLSPMGEPDRILVVSLGFTTPNGGTYYPPQRAVNVSFYATRRAVNNRRVFLSHPKGGERCRPLCFLMHFRRLQVFNLTTDEIFFSAPSCRAFSRSFSLAGQRGRPCVSSSWSCAGSCSACRNRRLSEVCLPPWRRLGGWHCPSTVFSASSEMRKGPARADMLCCNRKACIALPSLGLKLC